MASTSTKRVRKKVSKKPSRRKAKRREGVKPEAKMERKFPPTPPPRAKELLKLRERVRNSRPSFLRQESWRYGRLKGSWRKPKGIDSKMRLSVKGWPRLVKIGYGTPSDVRGLHPSGFRDVLVHNFSELERLNPDEDAARLASELGARKRTALVERAKELGILVLNPMRATPAKSRVKG